jgi:hypothetical protein
MPDAPTRWQTLRIATLILLAIHLAIPATAAPAAATPDAPELPPKRRPKPASVRPISPKTQPRAPKEPALADDLDMTRMPLLITYDPVVIGVGGPCPGDNELSIGECSLARKDFKVARASFLDAWNIHRSPFAAMRLGDISLLLGEPNSALQWYEMVSGSIMMQRMANLRRCEIEVGCGVTGKNPTKADIFTGPFGDEALLRTARIYAQSGFPELAAIILIDGDSRGCDIAPSTCEKIADMALRKAPTAATLALSLSTRRPGDGNDANRIKALRAMKLDTLADDLTTVSQGGKPARRVTQREIAAAEARLARAARQAAMRAEAEARRSADAAEATAPANPTTARGPEPAEVNAAAATPATATKPAAESTENTTQASAAGAEKEAPQKTPQQQAFDRRTKRDAIDTGLKSADESIEKARRLLELAGGALPLEGPE